jgi:hypothetical protein
VIEFMRLARTRVGERVRVLLADLRGVGQDTDDANAEPVDGAEMIFPHGFVSRPAITRTLEAVAVRIGNEVVALFAHDKGTSRFTTEVEDGEVRVYGPDGSMVRLRGDGSIDVIAASGKDIRVNGGTLEVARRSDNVQVTIPAGSVVIGGTSVTLNPSPITLNGTINSVGQSTFKA